MILEVIEFGIVVLPKSALHHVVTLLLLARSLDLQHAEALEEAAGEIGEIGFIADRLLAKYNTGHEKIHL